MLSATMSCLEDNPPEILCAIAQHLDSLDLSAFSRANRACEFAARPQLFRTVRLKLVPPGETDVHAQQYMGLLSARNSLHYVRRLEVGDRRRYVDAYDRTDRCEHLPYELFPEDTTDYTALLRLLSTLPALRDLVWTCFRQFPPCLLQALHSSSLNCRLHHETFRLRNLPRTPDRPLGVHEHEWALATSPCLYRIAVHYCEAEQYPRQVQNLSNCARASLLELVRYHASGLQEVLVHPSCSWALSLQQPKEGVSSYEPILQNEATPKSQGALVSLETEDWGPRGSNECVEGWFRATKSCVIKELKFMSGVPSALQYLSSLSWSSLRTLHLCLPSRHRISEFERYSAYLETFVQFLNGLRELRLEGEFEWSLLNHITQLHGLTLRRLFIPSLMVKDTHELRHLERSCPRLLELSIAMSRTEGDSHEFQMYSTLGGFQNLQHLVLMLDCSTTAAVGEPSSDNAESYHWPPGSFMDRVGSLLLAPNRAMVRDLARAQTNANVTAEIAASIFQSIANAKPACSIALQTLELRLRMAGEITNLDKNDARTLIRLLEENRRPWFSKVFVKDISWHCRRTVEAGISGCFVSRLKECHAEKESSINCSSPRGMDMRPLVIPRPTQS